MVDKRLFAEARLHRRYLASLLGVGILLAALTVWQAWLLSQVIAGAFLKHQPLASSLRLLSIYLLASLLRVLLGWFRRTEASHLAVSIKASLRGRVLRHLHAMGPLKQGAIPQGETTWLLTEGVDRLEAWFGAYLPQLLSAALIPATLLFFIFPREWLTGLVLLLTAPLIPLFMVLIGDVAKAKTAKQWKILDRMSGTFLDLLQGLTTLKVLGRAHEGSRRVNHVAEVFRRRTMEVLRVAFLSALILELITTLSTAVVAVEIGLRLLYAKMAFGPALFVLLLAPEFYLPLRLLGLRFHAGMDGVEAGARIFAILDSPVLPTPPAARALPLTETLHIDLRSVTARYQDSAQLALNEVSVAFETGRITVLAGPSGAGKSTLVRLLLRELEPEHGNILVNDIPLRDVSMASWLKQVAWVPQAPHLFTGSLAENLRLADPEADDARLLEILRAARLGTWVDALPDGLHTRLGEDALRVSEGEKQRLALARALLKDAPLIILDEHASALDPDNEREIQRALDDISHTACVIIIAHRLSTILRGDHVVILEGGRIIETGSPASLRDRGGLLSRWVAQGARSAQGAQSAEATR
ncbi:MAG: thiol reductant ABC exporter subunit CydD [Deltaproteobacteria bacterium]|nr:thiol reductant ABC exporter subunit CydD [Deltaproteobacteria bacterium]